MNHRRGFVPQRPAPAFRLGFSSSEFHRPAAHPAPSAPFADVLLLPVSQFLDNLGKVQYFTHSGLAATGAAQARRVARG